MKKIINVNVEIRIDEDEVILCSKYCFYLEQYFSPHCELFHQELVKIKQYDNPKRCDLCLTSKGVLNVSN